MRLTTLPELFYCIDRIKTIICIKSKQRNKTVFLILHNFSFSEHWLLNKCVYVAHIKHKLITCWPFPPITVFSGFGFILILRNVSIVSLPFWRIFDLIWQLGHTDICLCSHRTVSDSYKIQILFDFNLKSSSHSDSFTDWFRTFFFALIYRRFPV